MKLNKEKIIFLVILLFVVLTVISSKKDFTIIRINDDNACIRSNVYSNDNPYSVQFCNKNKVEIEYTGKDFDDKKTYLKIHNVVDFYAFYDVLKDETSYKDIYNMLPIKHLFFHIYPTEKPRKPYGSGASYAWTQ